MTKRVVVIEAKKLGAKLGTTEAAQVVKYASVLPVRWGIVTDGQFIKLYDQRPEVKPDDKLILDLDLAHYTDREDFEVTVYPKLAMLAKDAVAEGTGLEQRAAQEAIRDLLTTPTSASLNSLKTELTQKKLTQLDAQELADLLSDLLG